MNSPLAIIFAHRQPADYLVYAVAQARALNPGAEIHTLLDYRDPLVSRYARTADIFDYLEGVREFERDWINFSDLGYAYECFCSQRWLVLRNYARAMGLRRFLYLDSDVMTYADLVADLARFRDFPVSYAGGSAHTLLVEDFDYFEQFCSFMEERYRNPESVHLMHEQYRRHKERARSGGIQDMAHWGAFEKETGRKFGNLALTDSDVVVSTHCKVFDPALGRSKAVEFEWKNNQPYADDRYAGHRVRYSTIHFQGSYKYLISERFTAGDDEKRLIRELLFRRRVWKAAARLGSGRNVLALPFGGAKSLLDLEVTYQPRRLTYFDK